MRHKHAEKKYVESRFKRSALVGALAAISCAHTAHAQEVEEELVVTGVRATIQTSIDIKRNSTTIVDGLSATDIGEIPALSIGEALETLTGASSHRENGGATEISIRGMGPYLSATTFNGRSATNGSGDRSVNFSQFPSELMDKVAIYKTQDASMIEGAVAGLIELETVKPLDHGKRQIVFDLKGNLNPNQQNISNSIEGDLGYRGTASYIDQFDFNDGMALGISLGYEASDISQPEQEMRSSSPSGTSLYACLNDPTNTNEGFYRSSNGDCEDQVDGDSNQGYNTTIDPETGKAISDGVPYAFAGSSNGYRQNDTSDQRDAIFAAVQFQPNERWDINLDYQQSERIQAEKRHDLNFANQKRTTTSPELITPTSLVVTDKGTIKEWAGETAIESNSETYSRTEDYVGYGLKVAYNINDDITISADYGSSETTRQEVQYLVRTQSDNQDIYGESTPGGYRPLVTWDFDSGIRQYNVTDFDVTDHSLFSDAYRVRVDNDVDRTNTIDAFRADIDWKVGDGFITAVQGGVRFSELKYKDLGSARNEYSISRGSNADDILSINEACAIAFPESGFLSNERSGDLVTMLDSEGNVVGGSNSWATFDTMCVAQGIVDVVADASLDYPELPEVSASVTDVTETVSAAYVMAEFDSSVADTPVRGNFGVRVVQTEIDSIGYRTSYNIITNDDGTYAIEEDADAALEKVSAGGDYTEFLPSVNLIVDATDDVMVRGAVYRGMSRPDPADLGYVRSFDTNGSDDVEDINDLIDNVDGDGNPNMQPLMSWNADIAVEWYPNQDTMLAVGLYHKRFQGGFETLNTSEAFLIDGETVYADFDITRTSDETSSLTGIEITATHAFSYAPGFLRGFGVKASYNYANSDFEFEDSQYGSVTVLDDQGNVVSQTAGIVEPGNIPGFSDSVFFGQLYYGIGDFDASVQYKYRSEYFQPYTSNGTRLRYVGDTGVWEARASYKITDNVSVGIQAINLFDEPKEQYFFTNDNLGEVNSYGPRIFAGVKVKFK